MHAASHALVPPVHVRTYRCVLQVLEKFGTDKEFTCEYKYDGERAQVHLLEDGTIMIFSR